jgi:hypothetical protein
MCSPQLGENHFWRRVGGGPARKFLSNDFFFFLFSLTLSLDLEQDPNARCELARRSPPVSARKWVFGFKKTELNDL